MSSSGNLHIRLPAKLKKEAQKVIEASGLDVSSAIRLFFSHVVARRTIPLQFLTVNGIPADVEDALLTIAKDRKGIVGPFSSPNALLKSLYAED